MLACISQDCISSVRFFVDARVRPELVRLNAVADRRQVVTERGQTTEVVGLESAVEVATDTHSLGLHKPPARFTGRAEWGRCQADMVVTAANEPKVDEYGTARFLNPNTRTPLLDDAAVVESLIRRKPLTLGPVRITNA